MEANGKVLARFSRRTGWDLREGGLAAAIREARAQGRELLDLTLSNPTVCGFQYDTRSLLAALGDVRSITYEPDARGMASARSAVSGYYADHGAAMNPADLVLTTSTSEAYSYLFRLLCDAGDEVLVAQPSYPLFDFLADLDDVRLRGYPLFYDYGWWIDLAELERRITPRTRAILLVHPNNPTGHATGAIERQLLEEICLRHGLALVVDEVFLDFGLAGKVESFAAGGHPVLTFVVSGLSKIVGLPQMKVGWVGCFGPGREEALRRLEVIADTFLSVNAPVQHALPVWLAGRAAIQGQILDRVRENLEIARDAVEVLPVEAGWSAVLRLPWAVTGEEIVEEAGVIVHPGSFYGMEGRNRVVVSLLGQVEVMREGMRRLREFFAL
jgi:alanine-synthesizing transaminase